MNLKAYKKQFVRLVTRETNSACEVYAVLFESDGQNVVAISEPRLVRIILRKATLALKGFCSGFNILKGYVKNEKEKPQPVPSPYFPTLFGFSNSDFVIQISARPPTIN